MQTLTASQSCGTPNGGSNHPLEGIGRVRGFSDPQRATQDWRDTRTVTALIFLAQCCRLDSPPPLRTSKTTVTERRVLTMGLNNRDAPCKDSRTQTKTLLLDAECRSSFSAPGVILRQALAIPRLDSLGRQNYTLLKRLGEGMAKTVDVLQGTLD